ncbi:MAG: hypothetical protein V1722_01950 [Candidatus Micrarchaeota archaeon]
MILRPKSLEQMEQQLTAIPEAQRKVIVLVGRHVNEGTGILASRHHKSWEQHGAVVVHIPKHWTPHGLANIVVRRNLDECSFRKLEARVVSDDVICKFLYKRGFRQPIVNLHGTPFVDQTKDRTLVGFLSSSSQIHEHSGFFLHPEKVKTPNYVLAEFFFKGREPNKRLRDLYEQVRKFSLTGDKTPGVVNLSFGHLSGQAAFSYLQKPLAGKTDLDFFSKHLNPSFEGFLAHLAATGLKRTAVKPKVPRFLQFGF